MANCSGCFNFGECLQHEGTKYYGLDAACNNVEELCENFKNKADFVEVVRCKDCKCCEHCYPAKAIGEEAIEGWYCKIRKKHMRPDDFCSYGERKD